MDPYYPTTKDPLEVSYKDWLIMMQKNPERYNVSDFYSCTKSEPHSRGLYSSLGVNIGCVCDKMYDINAYRF